MPNDQWEPLTGAPNKSQILLANRPEFEAPTCFRAVLKAHPLCGLAFSRPDTLWQASDSSCAAMGNGGGGGNGGFGGVCIADTAGCLSQGKNILLNGFSGTVVDWEMLVQGQANWVSLGIGGPVLDTPQLYDTTQFRAKALYNSSYYYSKVVTINVVENPNPGTLSADQAVCKFGNGDTLKLEGHNGEYLQWQSSLDGGQTWSDIPGESGGVYVPEKQTQDTWYRVVSELCAVDMESNAVEVRVFNAFATVAGEIISAYEYHCIGQPADFFLQGFQGEIIAWEVLDPSENVLQTIPGNQAMLSLNNLAGVGFLRAKVRNNTCKEVYTDLYEITIQPGLQYKFWFRGNGPEWVCAGAETSIPVTGSGWQPVEWQAADASGGPWTTVWDANSGVAFEDFKTPPIQHDTKYRIVLNAEEANCPDETYGEKLFKVATGNLSTGTVSNPAVVCEGFSPRLDHIDGNYDTQIVDWYVSEDGGSTWQSKGHTHNSYQLQNLDKEIQVRVGVTLTGCAETFTPTITVSPKPLTFDTAATVGSLNPLHQICENESVNLQPSVSGEILGWESSTDGGASWTSFQGGSWPRVYPKQQTQYRARVANAGCVQSYTPTTTVQINPGTKPGVIQGPKGVCEGGIVDLQLAGHQGQIEFWRYAQNCNFGWGGNAVRIDTNVTSISLSGLAPGMYCVYAFVRNGACSGSPANTFYFNVGPTLDAGELSVYGAGICGDTPVLSLEGHSGDVVGWEYREANSPVWKQQASMSDILEPDVTGAGRFYRAVINSPGCGTARTNEVFAYTLPDPAPGMLTASKDFLCANAPDSSVKIALAGNNYELLQWERSEDGGQTWTVLPDRGDEITVNNLVKTSLFRAASGCAPDAPVYTPEVEIASVDTCSPVDPCLSFDVSATFTYLEATCENCANGVVIVRPQPAGIYAYRLNNGLPKLSPYFTNLLPGPHTITISDTATGCEVQTVAKVPFHQPLQCPRPTILSAIPDVTRALVTWTGVSEADEYIVYFRKYSRVPPSWRIARTNFTQITLMNLEPDTEYEYIVRSRCGDMTSRNTPGFRFQTKPVPSPCKPPSHLQVLQSNGEAVAVWTPSGDAVGHQISWRPKDKEIWTSVTLNRATPTEQSMTNLTPNRAYEVRARSVCRGFASPWVSTDFVTPAARIAGSAPEHSTRIAAYLNPNQGVFTLALENAKPGHAMLRLRNVVGQTVWEKPVTLDSHNAELPVHANLPSGSYFLELVQDGATTRFKIQIAR